jgi:diguanylate cyclase (GGDEF)-like protein/PAS domain S-box-containing protein
MPRTLPATIRDSAAAVELPLDAMAAYPGATAVIGADGEFYNASGAAASLVERLHESGCWSDVVAATTHAVRTGAAAVELFEPPGAHGPIEATLLPILGTSRVLALFRPVGFEQLLRQRLIESRQRYKDLVDLAGDFSWETDRDGRFSFISPDGALDWAAQDMIGRHATEFLIEATAEDEGAAFAARRPVRDAELRFRRADGADEWLSIRAMPLLDADGAWCGARGLCRKVTDERRREGDAAQGLLHDRLAAHLVRTTGAEADPEQALRAALSATGLAIAAVGGLVLRSGSAGESFLAAHWGDPADVAIVGAARGLLVSQGGRALARDDGHMLAAVTRFNEATNGVVALWRPPGLTPFASEDRAALATTCELLGSVIEQQTRHERAMALSRTDPLTGLLNRRGFAEEVSRRVARLARSPAPACLAFIDLDNFKLVNDARGHDAGDAALLELCRILHENSRSGDLIARLGGDEFVMWLDGVGEAAATRRGEAIVAACRRLADLTGAPARPLGVSVGLAIYDPDRPETADALLARADGAMYAAKRRGGGALSHAAPAAAGGTGAAA